MYKYLTSKKGFTLVELLIVVVVLGVLAAVAIPLFNHVNNNSKAKICKVNCRKIESEITTRVARSVINNKDCCKLKSTLKSDGTYDIQSKKFAIVTDENGVGVAYYEDAIDDIFEPTPLTEEEKKYCAENHISQQHYAVVKTFESFFEGGKVPCCPAKNGKIKVTVETTNKPGVVRVKAACKEHNK